MSNDPKTTYLNIKVTNLAGATGSNTVHSSEKVTCKNTGATSAEVKCSLPSSLASIKSLSDISVSGSFGSYTDVFVNIDTDYPILGNLLPSGQARVAHLEGTAHVVVAEGSVVGTDFTSVKVSNINKVEALIPPSSCFNLMVSGTVTTVNIPYAVTEGEVAIAGNVVANIVSADYNELTPCN